MKNIKYLFLSLLFAVTSCSMAPAQAKEIKFGTGSANGNYFAVGNDIANYCSDELNGDTLSVLESGGSVDNLLGFQSKKYSVGIIQEDVLNYYAKLNPKQVNKNRIKVVTGLHKEAVHLLIPKGYKPKTKGSWTDVFSGDEIVKIDLQSLKGQTIGSWGGSIVSTEALSYFFDLNLNVVNVPQDKRGANTLNIPILLVGGHPYKPVEEYLDSGKWNLISLDYQRISQVARFYSNENVAYTINGKAVNTPTVGVQALLVGKSFRKKSRNDNMSAIATCISENVADLADDPDTNPLWGSIYDEVDNDEQIDWGYFPLNEPKRQQRNAPRNEYDDTHYSE